VHKSFAEHGVPGKARRYYLSPLWLLGIVFLLLGAVLSFLVFAFLGQARASALAALTIVWNALLSRFFLKEDFTIVDLTCTAVIVAGAVISVIFGSSGATSQSVQNIKTIVASMSRPIIWQGAIVLFGVWATCYSVIRYSVRRKQRGTRSELMKRCEVYLRLLLAGIFSGSTGMLAKNVVQSISGAIKEHSAYFLGRFEFWLFLIFLPVSLLSQLYFLQSSLSELDSLEVVPPYQASIILIGLAWGWIFGSEAAAMSSLSMGMFILGAVLSCAGVLLLMFKRRLLTMLGPRCQCMRSQAAMDREHAERLGLAADEETGDVDKDALVGEESTRDLIASASAPLGGEAGEPTGGPASSSTSARRSSAASAGQSGKAPNTDDDSAALEKPISAADLASISGLDDAGPAAAGGRSRTGTCLFPVHEDEDEENDPTAAAASAGMVHSVASSSVASPNSMAQSSPRVSSMSMSGLPAGGLGGGSGVGRARTASSSIAPARERAPSVVDRVFGLPRAATMSMVRSATQGETTDDYERTMDDSNTSGLLLSASLLSSFAHILSNEVTPAAARMSFRLAPGGGRDRGNTLTGGSARDRTNTLSNDLPAISRSTSNASNVAAGATAPVVPASKPRSGSLFGRLSMKLSGPPKAATMATVAGHSRTDGAANSQLDVGLSTSPIQTDASAGDSGSRGRVDSLSSAVDYNVVSMPSSPRSAADASKE
jgi:drug/metabolite transporter (DMT)-like permease